VAKYFRPGYDRTGGSYGRYAGRGAELKFFDTSLSFLFDTTGEVPATGQLVLIPQGVTESTRVGRKCVIKSVHLKGITQGVPGAAATFATTAYLYLVLDKQANGAAAAFTDVMSTTLLATSFHNLANSQRFVVLKKMKFRHVANSGATTALNNTNVPFEMYKKCNIPIEYSGTTGAITEIRSNNIFLLASSDGQADDLVTMVGNCRVRFSDGS